ncbi:MAG TPA: 4-hydroxy-tetrahydrodipicolinate reductase [Burkholderiaceae bacterium]|nr:4-hydroxy-tetrahydrodipicolinate reductase [Burkholderiaceae bacterium]
MNGTPLRIAVAGASGRMGRMLIEAVESAPDCTLAATMDLGSDIRAALARAQVLIDFTRPEGTLTHLAACRELGVKAVIGTTGFTPAQKAELQVHAQHLALVLSPNMSVGVNVVLRLLETAARALGDAYDVEVVEAHHRHKVDAPSGTALAMGEAVAAATGRDLATHGVFARHGVTGERVPGSIGFATVRGGDIVGDHTVMFCGTGERVEIAHRSSSRATYAQGALRAARFLMDKPSGLFDMTDVLGLR